MSVVALPLWHGVEQVPPGWGPCVVTLGVFDGVHRGHARVIEHAVRLGRSRGLPAVLVTFDPHPARVVAAKLGIEPRDTAALSTVERRAALAGSLGVDAVCVLRFTEEFAGITAADFATGVLAGGLNAAAVVVGAGFTFGRGGLGTVDTLRELGFVVEPVELLTTVDSTCSSTHVRACLRAGDLGAAAGALGRPHRVDGTLAGPSGEILLEPGTALPPPGRYRDLRVTGDGRLFSELRGPSGEPVSVEFPPG